MNLLILESQYDFHEEQIRVGRRIAVMGLPGSARRLWEQAGLTTAYLGDEAIRNGIRCMISSWRRIGPNMIPATAKASGQYLNSQLAKMEALKHGYQEAILLNEQGMIFGATYQSRAVVPDGTPRPKVDDPVTEYRPSAWPGARAPQTATRPSSMPACCSSRASMSCG